MKRIAKMIAKHVLGLVIVALVGMACLVACVSVHDYTKGHAEQQIATSVAIAEQAKNDGTTHGLSIVWPSGKEESFQYAETITPRHSEYHGPVNEHCTVIDMISFNPLDSANKAGENIKPSTFAEGDKQALQLDDDGMGAGKAKGATSTGEAGSNPSLGEYAGWLVMGVIGIGGLLIFAGVGKWLWAEWEKIEPSVAGEVDNLLGIKPKVAAATVAASPPAATATATASATPPPTIPAV
jgi:hypothetical protein